MTEDATHTGQFTSRSAVNYGIDGSVAFIGAEFTGADWAALFVSFGRRVRLYHEHQRGSYEL